jgi:predicted enzyme related to lactoylglutathione lyase
LADPTSAAARTAAAGGRVLHAGAARGSGLDVTLVRDVEGAVFGLCGWVDPAHDDTLPAAGEWLWPALFCGDPATAARFYRETLGYAVSPEVRTPLFGGDLVFSRGVRARAGVMPWVEGRARRAGWLPVVRVDGLDAAVERARRAGGRVLLEPSADLIGGRVAVVADPFAAVLGLVELTQGPGLRGGSAPVDPDPAAAANEPAADPRPTPGDVAGADWTLEWHDPAFYSPWFPADAILLPPPMRFGGFTPDGSPVPFLPGRERAAAATP